MTPQQRASRMVQRTRGLGRVTADMFVQECTAEEVELLAELNDAIDAGMIAAQSADEIERAMSALTAPIAAALDRIENRRAQQKEEKKEEKKDDEQEETEETEREDK